MQPPAPAHVPPVAYHHIPFRPPPPHHRSGWQQLVKRGLHTLRQPVYEVLYVPRPVDGSPPRLLTGGALQAAKTLTSVHVLPR